MAAQERAEKAERERDERLTADNALIDRYRDPKFGSFKFPTDVAAIIRRLEAAEARAEKATAERAEWERWATTWHRTVETMMTIIGLSSSLGAAEVLSEFRREMDLRGAHKASLREALVEAIGVLERMADRADAIGERGYIADHLRRGANDVRARLSETSP